jgi:hypothetical protein
VRAISTKTHGFFDYGLAAFLFFVPNLFGFDGTGGAVQNVPRIAAGAIVLVSLFTRYEFGAFRSIPMKSHLAFDFVIGLVLSASPWLFGFAGLGPAAWAPLVAAGIGEVVLSLTTAATPSPAILPVTMPFSRRV